MKRMTKGYGFLLILGFIVLPIVTPKITAIYALDNPSTIEKQSKPSPSLLQGGEQSIDAFNVLPNNRWQNDTSGLVIESLESGEFTTETLINDSGSDYFYRNSRTSTDTIATRFRSNAVADFVTNETDWAVLDGNFGPAGWNFELGGQGWGGLAVNTVVDGQFIGLLTAGVGDFFDRVNIDADSDVFTHIAITMKTNDTELTMQPFDANFDTVGDIVFPTTDFVTYVWDASLDADWSGLESLKIRFDEDDGTLDGDEGVWIEEIHLYGNSQYPGDFETILAGFNSTTSEGIGNVSLNSYAYNSTHFSIRPSFSTNDGSQWRSWNLESDYQDYPEMAGNWGADGWDFLDGTDGFTGINNIKADKGIYTAKTSAAAFDDFGLVPINLNPSDFSYITLKMKTNYSTLTAQPWFTNSDGLVFIGSAVTVRKDWSVFVWNATDTSGFSDAEEWTQFNIRLDESDGTLDGDEGIWLDYVRITTEPFPLEITDYAVFSESWGIDGWDWNEGTNDGWIWTGGETNTNTYLNSIWSLTVTGNSGNNIAFTVDAQIPTEIFDGSLGTLTIRAKANNNDSMRIQLLNGGAGMTDSVNPTTVWTNYSFVVNSNWNGLIDDFKLFFREETTGGNFDGNEIFYIDWFKIEYTDSSLDEISLFNYDDYYRLELDYELRRSELGFLILDDEQNDLVEENIGAFSISAFFDTQNLIPDIFVSTVGLMTYNFGMRGEGANVSFTIDYYEAKFDENRFIKISATGSIFNSTDAYHASQSNYQDATTGATANYRLTVPELDSLSGTLIANEYITEKRIGGWQGLTDHKLELIVFSVDSSTGSLTEELYFQIDDNNALSSPTFVYRLNIRTDGTPFTNATLSKQVVAPVDASGLIGSNHSRVTFSIVFDKINRKLSAGVGYINNTQPVDLAIGANVTSLSNEFIIGIGYSINWTASAPRVRGISSLSVDNFQLTVRDFLGIDTPDIKIPFIDQAVGGIDFGFGLLFIPLIESVNLLGKTVNLLSDIPAILIRLTSILGTLANVLTQLISIDTLLSILDASVGAVETAVDAVTVAVELVEGAIDLVEEAVRDLETILDTIDTVLGTMALVLDNVLTAITALAVAVGSAIIVQLLLFMEDLIDQALLFIVNMVDAAVAFVRDIGIEGVTIGAFLDILSSWLQIVTNTFTSLSNFAGLLLVTHTDLTVAGLFVAGIVFPILFGNTPGDVARLIYSFFSFDVLPFSVFGNDFHVPSGFIIIPFTMIVIMGVWS